MATYLTIVNNTIQECGVSGTLPTAMTGNSLEQQRIITWVNTAWQTVQRLRADWQWMRKTATFVTVTSQPINTQAYIGLTDFGEWQHDTFRNYVNPTVTMTIASPAVVSLSANNLSNGDTVAFYTTGALPTGITSGTTYYVVSAATDTFQISATSGGAAINTSGSQSGTHTMTSNNTTVFVGIKSEIFMPYIDYEWWRDGYLFGALRQVTTRPMEMTVTPAKGIGLAPAPISGYTVIGDYYQTPQTLSATTDTPGMPAQFHDLLMWKAMMHYGAFEAAQEVYQRGQEEYMRLLRALVDHQGGEILTSGAMS